MIIIKKIYWGFVLPESSYRSEMFPKFPFLIPSFSYSQAQDLSSVQWVETWSLIWPLEFISDNPKKFLVLGTEMEKEFFGNGKVDPLNILLKQSSLYFLYFLRLSLAFLEDEMVEPSLQKLWEVHPQRSWGLYDCYAKISSFWSVKETGKWDLWC